jgi:hypothetical protein
MHAPFAALQAGGVSAPQRKLPAEVLFHLARVVDAGEVRHGRTSLRQRGAFGGLPLLQPLGMATSSS